MKTKTIAFSDKLWVRMQECMAQTKIFNASEFVRLSVEAAVERVEKKYNLPGPAAVTAPLSARDEGELVPDAAVDGVVE